MLLLGQGFSIAGRVDAGYVQVGENVLILPAQEAACIKCEYFFMC